MSDDLAAQAMARAGTALRRLIGAGFIKAGTRSNAELLAALEKGEDDRLDKLEALREAVLELLADHDSDRIRRCTVGRREKRRCRLTAWRRVRLALQAIG